MSWPVDLKQVADFLGCSTRRVRALLQQGRIDGYKEGRVWKVLWPPHIRPGTRGPDLRHYAVRKIYGLAKGRKAVG